ncbi:MAG: SAM-dependent methyltransferase [Proteobacteria bacterium]|nr:SAM-dependent methyltransferase [Pseudomonadota bacterium]
MKHKIYFIGAGPGSAEHLTIYGLEKLKKSKYVFAPNIYKKTFQKFLKGKEVFDPFDYLFNELVSLIENFREKSSVAFLLPGDETVFSPFQPFIDYYKEECEVIPGVGVVNSASAILKKTLDLPNIANTIVLTSTRSLKSAFEDHDFMQFVKRDVTLVLYMNHIPLEELTKRLIPILGKECPIAILYKISLPEQEVVSGTLGNICRRVKKDYFESSKEPSMAMIIIGYVLKERAKKSSWDYRKKHIWDKRKK